MTSYFFDKALLPDGWANNVRISIDKNGKIEKVLKDQTLCEGDIAKKERVALPAPVNLHSHGFQRAIAGLTEYKSSASNDSFWTWRKLMYAFLDHIEPHHFKAINAMAQMEMLETGYGTVTEFHYVHNPQGGGAYESPSELSEQIIQAASESGIGLTLLPVYYHQGGVDGRVLKGGQLRFQNNIESFSKLHEAASAHLQALGADHKMGIAPHSLRAVPADHLKELEARYKENPIHIHIAEQMAEIEEIENAYGKRPVEWLYETVDVNKDWCLVHATHLSAHEKQSLAKSQAIAGLCPVTEANLGDGVFDSVTHEKDRGVYGVGTDSNISISLVHELRMLEYSQRLSRQNRSVLCTTEKSNGRILFENASRGGAQAAGRYTGELKEGYWADLLTLDLSSHELDGLDQDFILDSWIFASNDRLIKDVFSAGRHVVQDGIHIERDQITKNYIKTIRELRNLI